MHIMYWLDYLQAKVRNDLVLLLLDYFRTLDRHRYESFSVNIGFYSLFTCTLCRDLGTTGFYLVIYRWDENRFNEFLNHWLVFS